MQGGKAVHYLCDEQADWYPDLADIRKKITRHTKAIVIINPNNPTGALYPKEVLEGIVEIARQHHLIIFSDEIYDRLVMDGGEHISIASLAPDLFCVTFSGLSKSHMIAGFRIGWMILSGNKAIAQDYIEGIRMLSNMRLCSNVPAQSIVQTALGGYQSVSNYLTPGGRIYEQRECIYQALKDIPGLSVVKPKAAFYMFPKLDVKKFHITNDEQFALDLLRDKKILLIHGGGFHWEQPDHFRVVYLPRIEVLKESADKIADFLSYYQQNRCWKKTSPAAQELPVRTSRRRAGFSLSQNFKLRFEHHLGPICPKAAFFAYKGIPESAQDRRPSMPAPLRIKFHFLQKALVKSASHRFS